VRDLRATLWLGAALGAIASLAAAQPPPPERCEHCGTIVDIKPSTTKSTWTPLGSVSPGTMPGDYAGGQQPGRVTAQYRIGPEMKNQGMVLLGSAGGGGYAKRPDSYEQPRWDVSIRMDAGGTRPVSLGYEPPFRVGDRVRVFGTQLELVQP
jgi:hypothetical protein